MKINIDFSKINIKTDVKQVNNTTIKLSFSNIIHDLLEAQNEAPSSSTKILSLLNNQIYWFDFSRTTSVILSFNFKFFYCIRNTCVSNREINQLNF